MKLKTLVFATFFSVVQIQHVSANAWSPELLRRCLMLYCAWIKPKELVWFLNEEFHNGYTAEQQNFIRSTGDQLQLTQTVITNNSNMRMSGTEVNRNTISLLFTSGVHDPVMETFNKVLTRRHYYGAFLILAQPISDIRQVNELCEFLYLYNYANGHIYFRDRNGLYQVYRVNIFPKFQIINITDFGHYMEQSFKQIEAAVHKVHGFRFVTPLRQDLPHLFQFTDRQGVQRYEGTAYHIINTFIQLINGSMVDRNLPSDSLGGLVVDMKTVLALVRTREIEFSAHAYALFRMDEQVDKSYPLVVVQLCLMVPLQNSLATYLYPLLPFQWSVWFFVLVVFIALLTLDLLTIYFHYVTKHGSQRTTTLPVQRLLLDDFCYTLNLACERPLRQLPITRFLLLVTISFYGFFLAVSYTSLLGSILTVTIFRDQINTIDDIIKAELPVMIIDYELEFLLSDGYAPSHEFSSLLRPVASAIFVQHQFAFNTSFAYFVTEDNWRFLDKQQAHLEQRLFKFSKICFGSYHLSFPIQMDTSLWRDLEYYIYRVHSSGLLNYYERIAFQHALQAKLVTRLPETHEYTSASLQHLTIPFLYLGVMHVIACLLMILELRVFQVRSY